MRGKKVLLLSIFTVLIFLAPLIISAQEDSKIDSQIEELINEIKNYLAKDEFYIDEHLEKLRYFESNLEKMLANEDVFKKKIELINLLNRIRIDIAWLNDMKNISSEQMDQNISSGYCKQNFDEIVSTSDPIISATTCSNQQYPDIEAIDVYLSYKASDWNKQDVVERPLAGDALYIHWVYSIHGEGVIDPFHVRISLFKDNGDSIIDKIYVPTNRHAGYIYKYCFTEPWITQNGDYHLAETVDCNNEIEEQDETNNVANLFFTVHGVFFYPNHGGKHTEKFPPFFNNAEAGYYTPGNSPGIGYARVEANLYGGCNAASWMTYSPFLMNKYGMVNITVSGKLKGKMGGAGWSAHNLIEFSFYYKDLHTGKMNIKYLLVLRNKALSIDIPWRRTFENIELVSGHEYAIGCKLVTGADVFIGSAWSKFDWTLDRITVEV